MIDLDISFEEAPWEGLLRDKEPGSPVSAADLLTLLEGEEEQEVEAALLALEEARLDLDLSGLPRAGGVGEAAARLRQEIRLAKKGLDPRDLEPGDPLRLYLEEVARLPAAGEEGALAQAAASGDGTAMERLAALGLSRVIALASEHVGYGVLLLDLIQEGSLGLWQAVQSYRGGDYPALRDRAIRFAMARAVTLQARANGVGQKLRAALEDYRAVDQRLLSDLGRNPTAQELAQALHMSPEELAAVERQLESADAMARLRKEPEPEEEREQAVEDTALFQTRQRVGDLLSGLSQDQARVLRLRFGLEGGKPLSPEEVGRRLGLAPDEVVAAEAAALAKLREKGDERV